MEHKYKFNGKRGQLTLLDLVMVPILVVMLLIISVFFLQSQTANLINEVNIEPTAQSCIFGLSALYGSYYVHTASALSSLQSTNTSLYFAASSGSAQQLTTTCGSNCSSAYSFSQNSLDNSSSLFSDFIKYFSSFSISYFNLIKDTHSPTLQAFGMDVFLNQIPTISYTPAYTCALSVYNPANPSQPYNVYGIVK